MDSFKFRQILTPAIIGHVMQGTTNIAHRISIHERPKEADGKRFGDWEMDTIVDPFGHAILTLTERSTNFIMMERLPHGRRRKYVR